MLRGVFWSLPELFSSPPRPILRPGRFLVMWALGGLFPAAEIAHEVDGGDDGACVFLGDRAAYVPLLAVGCSLGDAAVGAAATAVLERAAERCHERTELRDAPAVFVACHQGDGIRAGEGDARLRNGWSDVQYLMVGPGRVSPIQGMGLCAAGQAPDRVCSLAGERRP